MSIENLTKIIHNYQMITRKTKIVTLCRAGLVRSAALAWILKNKYFIDCFPVGCVYNTPETLKMTFEWADVIVPMWEKFITEIPQEYRHKIVLCDVGEDTYGNPHHPDLMEKVIKWCKDHINE